MGFIFDTLTLIGVALIIYGCFLLATWLGFIVLGVAIIAFAQTLLYLYDISKGGK